MSSFAGIIFSLSGLICLCNVATNAPLTARTKTNIFQPFMFHLFSTLFSNNLTSILSRQQDSMSYLGLTFVFIYYFHFPSIVGIL